MISSRSHTSFIRNDMRLVPLSDKRPSGTSKDGMISFTRMSAIHEDFWAGIGNTNGHLDKKS